jgi:serine/threonine protein kinase
LFALGATAYEVFTGHLPWERAASSEETLRRHMNLPARDPRNLCKGLDEPLYRFLQKAVASDREARFQSALEFRDALRAIAPKEQIVRREKRNEMEMG